MRRAYCCSEYPAERFQPVAFEHEYEKGSSSGFLEDVGSFLAEGDCQRGGAAWGRWGLHGAAAGGQPQGRQGLGSRERALPLPVEPFGEVNFMHTFLAHVKLLLSVSSTCERRFGMRIASCTQTWQGAYRRKPDLVGIPFSPPHASVSVLNKEVECGVWNKRGHQATGCLHTLNPNP